MKHDVIPKPKPRHLASGRKKRISRPEERRARNDRRNTRRTVALGGGFMIEDAHCAIDDFPLAVYEQEWPRRIGA
jgi:hypothetical protein